MKRVLIASPVRGGLSTNYVRSVIALMNSTLCNGPKAEYKFDFAWTSGTSVAMARDEIANLFLTRGDDELIFWDVDLVSNNPGMMLSMFARLLSHDVDIVGGAYVGHNFLSQWHGAAINTDATMDDRGLLEMAQIPIGFSKIKRCVFEKIRKDHGYLEYIFRETQMDKAKTGLFEFFPNGLVGPTTGQGKVDRIKAILARNREDPVAEWQFDALTEIEKAVNDSDHSKNIMLGEDFYFCLLARQSGFKMYIDNQLIMPHETSVRLPVQTSIVMDALAEPWRWADSTKPEQVISQLNNLRKLMGANHPA